ncbi:abortive infection family protein [Exiguobacterium sp. s91]|uniref:DUF7014 domain-containing protein n=1 Tax=Exiguobacterium sp. s91 TaxID=2751199 RepID=UPI001BE79209|nr:abortive infection family protein [Exiguobacterium sp. s91]
MINGGLSGVELFSERMFPTRYDVLEYKIIPKKARVQVFQQAIKIFDRNGLLCGPTLRENIFNRCLTNFKDRRGVIDTDELLSEYALENIFVKNKISALLQSKSVDEIEFYSLIVYADDDLFLFLDLIELLSYYTELKTDESISKNLDKVINNVFHHNGLGYEIIGNQIIHKGNDIVHKEVVRPSLQFLSDLRFKNANDEMLKAFSDFKNNDYKGAIHNANKAFESTMKIIIEMNNWDIVSPTASKKAPSLNKATPAALISTIAEHSEIEGFHNLALKGLKDSLQSLATLRNSHAGHGQGSEIKDTYIRHCEFALHTAATNILFLIMTFGKN